MSIEVKHVTKHIRGVTILDDVSLSVSNGAIAAIAGPNGSGKTMPPYYRHRSSVSREHGDSYRIPAVPERLYGSHELVPPRFYSR